MTFRLLHTTILFVEFSSINNSFAQNTDSIRAVKYFTLFEGYENENENEYEDVQLDLSMPDQRILVEKLFIDWKGDLEQIDDVCVMGIKM